MFRKAQESTLKTDYQDIIRSFPQGFYARRVREEILPTCTGDMRDVWREPQLPPGQMFRAISPTEDLAGNTLTYDTEEAACTAAQEAWSRDADRYCRAFTGSMETRNTRLGTTLADCECQDVQGNWWCLTDSTYTCRYEMKTQEYVEVCG